MSVFQAIIGLLSSLPALLKLVSDFATWLNHISGNDIPGFVAKVNSAINELKKASTESDRANAAKTIADLIYRIPR